VVDSYHSSVNYNQSLLNSALVRLENGKIESRKVFEIEADLFEAKNSVVESLVRYEIAQLEIELLEGVLLVDRDLEITQTQLEAATEKFGSSSRVGDVEYRQALQDIQKLYESRAPAVSGVSFR